jgi:hypothetical protein
LADAAEETIYLLAEKTHLISIQNIEHISPDKSV